MREMISRLRREEGVAMVTVLLVGASLTAVASVAAFSTVREFRATGDDRRASEALSIAEAGVDRMSEYLRGGTVSWGELRLAGCDADHPAISLSGNVEPGSFVSTMTVYEEGQPLADVCTARQNAADPSPRTPKNFAIVSEGTHPTAKRVVRQVVAVGVVRLPIGIYADNVVANGSSDYEGISLITPNDVEGREKMSFFGTDPYYFLNDFWPGESTSLHAPAAIHTLKTIYLKKLLGNTQEHPPSKNCTANANGNPINGNNGTAAQSLWDQSGAGGPITSTCSAGDGQTWAGSPTGPDLPTGPGSTAFPPTSKIDSLTSITPKPNLSEQDYLALKAGAKRDGLYCFIPKDLTKPRDCRARGGTIAWTSGGNGGTVIVEQAIVDSVLAVEHEFVAYFEYEDASQAQLLNQMEWRASVTPCSDDLAANRSVTIIIRNGSYDKGTANTTVNGFLLAPEGTVVMRGGHVFHGTIIAKRVDIQGTAEFQLDNCWVRNMPGPFLDYTPGRWSEVDR